MPTNIFSGLTAASSALAGLQSIVPQVKNLATQIQPFCYCIAFVMLVVGTMRGFLRNDTQHLFSNLVRVVILVALIGSWPTIENAVNNAVNSFCNLQVGSNFFSSTSSNSSGRLNLAWLEATIAQKAAGINVSQPGWETALSWALSPISHLLNLVLYGTYLLTLLLCDLIAVGMNLLQQCIIILFDLYVPIGFAEFSIPSLRGQAETFFKAYVGLQCWPIGWIFANIVAVALLNGLAPPSPENAAAIVIAIVLCIPVILWIVIGYVLAPFYVQKVVIRGGTELQAFAGAMISAVGGTSGAVYGGAFGMAKRATLGLNQGIGAIKYPINNWGSGSQQNNNAGNQDNSSNGQQGSGIDDALGSLLPEYRDIEESGGSNGGAADRARNLGVRGLSKAMDAGEFAARTAGNMANTLGALVADASGNRIGPERGFSLPRMQRNSSNRSSRRAANYLNQSTPNQSNPDPSDLNSQFPND
jgi:hypothetical protein